MHQCIRPLLGALAPDHHGYQRARDVITGQASTGPFGSPVFACAGKTDPPLLVSSSRRPRSPRLSAIIAKIVFDVVLHSGEQVVSHRNVFNPNIEPGRFVRIDLSLRYNHLVIAPRPTAFASAADSIPSHRRLDGRVAWPFQARSKTCAPSPHSFEAPRPQIIRCRTALPSRTESKIPEWPADRLRWVTAMADVVRR